MTEKNPQNRPIGYARVSTYGQTLAAQRDQLRLAGCTKIFPEKRQAPLAGPQPTCSSGMDSQCNNKCASRETDQ